MRWDWPQLHPKRFDANLKDAMGLAPIKYIPKKFNAFLIVAMGFSQIM